MISASSRPSRRRLPLCLLTGLLLFSGLLAAGPGPAAGDEAGEPHFPSAGRVPDLKRLPDGRIVVIEPAAEQTAPAAQDAAAGRAEAVAQPAAAPAPRPKPALPPAPVQSAAPRPAATGNPPPVVQPNATLHCAQDAITCLRIRGRNRQAGMVPVTFGQPFKAGDAPLHAALSARDDKGNPLSLQMDERVAHPDGSLRFAVLSTILPAMAPGESRVIQILKSPPAAAEPPAVGENRAPLDYKVEITTFSNQITEVKFGDRQGTRPGTPFQEGETVTLRIGDESFSVRVEKNMTAGNVDAYMRLAQAFVPVINAGSHQFVASWSVANDGYEKLWLTAATRGKSFTVTPVYQGQAKIAVSFYSHVETPETWVATLDPAAKGRSWLNGPIADERDIAAPLVSQVSGKAHPHLAVRFHLRRYAAAKAARVDIVVENSWAYEPGPRNYTYDVAIRRDGQAVFTHANITHYHHARFHRVVWSENADEPMVIHDIGYFLDSRAVSNYDRSLQVSAAVARDVAGFAKADTSPMATAGVTTYMPMTGGRPDIGPLPRWAVLYLLSMDEGERTILFANADAGGSIPIHYRDKKTDFPVTLDDHPTMAMTNGTASREDAFPPRTMDVTPWAEQTAHHPSLFYLPYLLSGDLYYLEEQTYWATWVMASVDPAYRGQGKGSIVPNEVRGQAWALRTLGEVVAILPEGHPLKAYFAQRLTYNISLYLARWVNNHDPEQSPVLGIIPKPDDTRMMAPWQQDFLFAVLGHLAEQEVPGTAEILRWLGRFTVGRWVADAEGYCHQMAPAYYIKIRAPDDRFLSTMKDIFVANWPEAKGCPATFPFGNPEAGSGYVGNAYAALAYGVDFNIAGAGEARQRLRTEAPLMFDSFASDPTFAIVPRH